LTSRPIEIDLPEVGDPPSRWPLASGALRAGAPQEGDTQKCDCNDDEYRRLVKVPIQEAEAAEKAERDKNIALAAKAGGLAALLAAIGAAVSEAWPALLLAL
jgi:hypothetical protein